jgi:hypothetical protein
LKINFHRWKSLKIVERLQGCDQSQLNELKLVARFTEKTPNGREILLTPKVAGRKPLQVKNIF